MFLKAADKKDKDTGKIYRYYKLCESYRLGDKVRHRTLLILGKLDDIQTDTEKKLLADRIEYYLYGTSELFPGTIPDSIDTLAKQFTQQIKAKGLTQSKDENAQSNTPPDTEKDIRKVDISSIEMEDVREIGAEWLCKQALDELKLEDHLKSLFWSDNQIQTALLHIISRAAYPASEHKTAQWVNENSSVCELFGKQPWSINRFHLYRVSRMLYKEKESIENHLSVKTNQLFDLDDKIFLYDLTNTYFEGRKEGSEIARFGRSKEKRSDAKIVALALVVNMEGFVKYSQIYRGNIADCKTLGDTVEALAQMGSCCEKKPVVVIDAGIATAENLQLLKSMGYHYVCVSRSRLKDYNLASNGQVQIMDKRENPIEICWVERPEDDDQYLYVHSQLKAVKESSMTDHFCDRFEEELDNVARGIHKKGGTKKFGKVMERIGRIKERYPSANKYYYIDLKQEGDYAVEMTWRRKRVLAKAEDGVYFIRTSIQKENEKDNERLIWDIYNTIREVEESFRILKNDLHLRPVFHIKDDNTMAHLFLGILAYSVVNTIRYRLKNHGIHHDWKNIVRIMNTQKAGTVSMNEIDGKKIYIRLCSKPTINAQEIYSAMGYKPMPFHRKKFVFPES